jgi:hypothetical protein
MKSVLHALPIITFTGTAIVIMIGHVRAQIPFYRAFDRLRDEMQRMGQPLSFSQEMNLKLRLFDELDILEPEDTASIKEMKLKLVTHRKEIRASLRRSTKTAFVGMGLTVVAGLISLLG